MKTGFLQFNAIVGDLEGNASRLAEGYLQATAEGADVVIAPELALTGYPPRDLVFKSRFVPRNLELLEALAARTGATPLLVGYIDRNNTGRGAPLRNAAAVLRNGRIQARIFKTRLPTYDVFDEARYFEPAESVEVIEIAGIPSGITICEDIWEENHLPAPLYRRDPAIELRNAGAKQIFNLSASPYHLGKPAARRQMLAEKARALCTPLIYVNAVGGNDQLVFDGHSLALDSTGSVTFELPGFTECVRVADVQPATNSASDTPPCDDTPCEELHSALVLGLRDYVQKCGFSSAILGLSGGIDSALVAALAAEALDPENVLGVLMPGPYSSDHSIRDALDLAANLGIATHTVPISPMVDAALDTLAPVRGGRHPGLTEENIQARLRGVTLMALSNEFGHLLLTTGNKSELAVGYCTIYGDMCGGLAVISDVPKTRVFELCRWLNRTHTVIPENTIAKPPSAELRPDQTDQDSLPPYDELDAILEAYIEKHLSGAEISALGFDTDTVKRVIRLVDVNEWKRHQAAPGLRVTTKAFGVGRRIPIAQRFDSR